MVECPSISETILGFTLRVNRSVAHVCLRSWKRTGGSPARLSRGLKRRLVTVRRSRGAPDSEANMRPFSCHREPAPWRGLGGLLWLLFRSQLGQP